MNRETLMAAIHGLEKLKQEQNAELKQTESMIGELRRRLGIVPNEEKSITEKSFFNYARRRKNASKNTIADWAIQLMKDANRPMHVKEIASGIESRKGLEKGSVERASVQTSIIRLMRRSDLVKKVGPGTYQYNPENEKTPRHLVQR